MNIHFAKLFLVCLAVPLWAIAQPDTLWSKTIKEGKWTETCSVLALNDGYIMAGSSGDLSEPFWDVIVTRINNNGETLWENLYLQESYVYSSNGIVLPSGDNEFVVFATICPLEDPSSDYDIGYFNIDGDGNIIHHGLLQVPLFQFIADAINTSDGGYLIACNNNYPALDMLLLKVDSDFNIEWQKSFGGNQAEWTYWVIETADGGFLAGGSTDSYGGEESECYIVKTDSEGNFQFQHSFGSSYSERISDIIETADGEYTGLWVKFTGSFTRETTVFSFSQQTGVTEYATFPCMAIDMALQADNTIAFTGTRYPDFILKCISLTGSLLWEVEMNDGALTHVGKSLCVNNDGGLLVAASQNTGSGELEGWILNFEAYSGIEVENSTPNNLHINNVFPNPFTSSVTLEYYQPSYGTVELLIYDLSGKLIDHISNSELEAGMHTLNWIPDVNLSPGCYLAVINTCGETVSERCILIR